MRSNYEIKAGELANYISQTYYIVRRQVSHGIPKLVWQDPIVPQITQSYGTERRAHVCMHQLGVHKNTSTIAKTKDSFIEMKKSTL